MSEHCTAVARMKDGREIMMTGTMAECSNWADNVIRAGGYEEINIRPCERLDLTLADGTRNTVLMAHGAPEE